MAGINGLRALFNSSQLVNVFNQFQEKVHDGILQKLQYSGEVFVNAARTNSTYLDDTGNLRSSIGYVILLDGKVVDVSFSKQKGSGDGDLGKLQGMTFASEVAEQYPTGYVLIGVAGMQYAASVEAHGYDVMTGAANEAIVILKSVLNEI